MRRIPLSLRVCVALLFAALFGCAASNSEAPAGGNGTVIRWLTGTVTFRERIPLPREVYIRVELMDVSGKDGPPRTVAMQEIAPAVGRQLPVPFEISYLPAIIDPERTYALLVKIFQGRNVLFANTTGVNVITNGVRNNVEVVVEPVPASDGGSR